MRRMYHIFLTPILALSLVLLGQAVVRAAPIGIRTKLSIDSQRQFKGFVLDA